MRKPVVIVEYVPLSVKGGKENRELTLFQGISAPKPTTIQILRPLRTENETALRDVDYPPP